MVLYDFVSLEKPKEALVLPSDPLVLDLEYKQVESLHKQNLTKTFN